MKQTTHIVIYAFAVLLGVHILLVMGIPAASAAEPPVPYGNGDCNGDGKIDISDPVYMLSYLFSEGPPPVPIVCHSMALDPLGRGYDIFDEYANRMKVKEPILDTGALENAGRIEEIPLESSDYSSLSGTNIDAYSSSLMQSCGLSGTYKGFSGSIRQSFSKSRYTSTEYSYATVKINVHKTAHVITNRLDSDSLKPFLTDTFSQNLHDSDYPPAKLFETYGTHCMTGVIKGARLDYNVSAKTSDLSGSKSLSVYAEMSYKTVLLGASLDTSVLTQEEYNQYRSSEEKKLRAFGGSSEFAVSIATKGDYESWLGTINDHPSFCNYYFNSLTPIWEFCDDETRKTEIKEAFADWAALREIAIPPAPRLCIVGVTVKNSNMGESIEEGGLIYHRIYQDLNEGAGGKTILIYAAVGLDNDPAHPPVTSMVLWDSSDEKSKPDWLDPYYVRVSGDLNEGAGGDSIWLYCSWDPLRGDPIHAIRTYDVNDNDYRDSQGANSWLTWLPVLNTAAFWQDTSEGAGGDVVHLQFSRDYID